jgi:Domain of unknown function (DUF4136)
MTSRLMLGAFLCAVAAYGQVKAKLYGDPEGCVKTYHLATGRVLTSRGLIEDPTVNAIMKDAVSAQMNELRIAEAGKGAELEVRFMGGNSAGLQTDDLAVGDVAIWDIGGAPAVSGRTYKKSSLVIAVVDNKSNRTLWAARCGDKFGDPVHIQERIQKAVAKAFAKFPKKFACAQPSP